MLNKMDRFVDVYTNLFALKTTKKLLVLNQVKTFQRINLMRCGFDRKSGPSDSMKFESGSSEGWCPLTKLIMSSLIDFSLTNLSTSCMMYSFNSRWIRWKEPAIISHTFTSANYFGWFTIIFRLTFLYLFHIIVIDWFYVRLGIQMELFIKTPHKYSKNWDC